MYRRLYRQHQCHLLLHIACCCCAPAPIHIALTLPLFSHPSLLHFVLPSLSISLPLSLFHSHHKPKEPKASPGHDSGTWARLEDGLLAAPWARICNQKRVVLVGGVRGCGGAPFPMQDEVGELERSHCEREFQHREPSRSSSQSENLNCEKKSSVCGSSLKALRQKRILYVHILF